MSSSSGNSSTDGRGTPDEANTTAGLAALQSTEHFQLLDAMDQLRAFGVSQYISLPQLIVCGDQSAGKSSLLEAITQVPFPRKDNLCTRFATEIVLRRSPGDKATVKILPDPSSAPESHSRRQVSTFKYDLKDFSELPKIIDMASATMGVGPGSTQTFSRDVLSIEISGPQQPHLTVVDLPGLIHVGSTEGNGEGDVDLVQALVHSYMARKRSIILAVVSAAGDYQNQVVLTRAKKVDPHGRRTLGVITKPDMLPVGSESQIAYHALAENKSVKFTLGWHVVRNRKYEERELPNSERDRLEEDFFSKGVWASLKRENVGISTLRAKLSELLYLHIRRELPEVIKEVERELGICEDQLQSLGESRGGMEEMRGFLTRLASSFGEICKASVKGFYEEEFFGEGVRITAQERSKRLRAVVQKQNRQFEETLRARGHLKEIVPNSAAQATAPLDLDVPHKITLSQALRWVQPLVENGQGRELPGTFNPLMIGNLFWEQSRKWPKLGESHLDTVFSGCQKFVHLAVDHFTTPEVATKLFHHWLNARLNERNQLAQEALTKLHATRRQHPITYNRYFIELVQESRAKDERTRHREAVLSSVSTAYGNWDDMPPTISINKVALLERLKSKVTVDMEQWACEEVLRYMLAYYQVALKTYVDNVATEVVERHLLSELHEIFDPLTVMDMSDETVQAIAAESNATKRLRAHLVSRQDELKKGLKLCIDAAPEAEMGYSGNEETAEGRTPSAMSESESPPSPPADEGET